MTAPSDFTTVYFDSCVLIKYVVDKSSHPEIGAVMRLVERGQLMGVISGLHWVEVLGKQRQDEFDSNRESLAQSLLNHPDLQYVDLGPEVLQRARQYALHQNFKPMDSIHIASAVIAGAEVFMTYDDKLKLDRDVDGVWLARPYEPGEPPLFSA